MVLANTMAEPPVLACWAVGACPSVLRGGDCVFAEGQRSFKLLKAKEKGHLLGFPFMAVGCSCTFPRFGDA